MSDITDEDVAEIRQQVNGNVIVVFKGSMKVDQVVQDSNQNTLYMKSMICFACPKNGITWICFACPKNGITCNHWSLGTIQYKSSTVCK